MNIQRDDSTAFSIYQRHLLPICLVDCSRTKQNGNARAGREIDGVSCFISRITGRFLVVTREREGGGAVKSSDRAGNYVSYRTGYLVADEGKGIDDLELFKKIGEAPIQI